MLYQISRKDLLEIPQFSNLTLDQLLSTETDAILLDLFEDEGVDKTQGVFVQACKHRNSKREIVLDYRWLMIERTDKEWTSNPKSSLESRVYGKKDLIKELNNLGNSLGVENFATDKWEVLDYVEVEEDEQETIVRIMELHDKQREIRGYIRGDEDVLSCYKSKKELRKEDMNYISSLPAESGWGPIEAEELTNLGEAV